MSAPWARCPTPGPEEALAFFSRRFDDLEFEVALLEQRVSAGARSRRGDRLGQAGARRPCTRPRPSATWPGSTPGSTRCGATRVPAREAQQSSAPASSTQAKGEKERIAAEAEQLSEGTDWRNGANRMRDLLDEWKTLPRLEKPVDDALWRRFSTARTTYTRRRKSHFSEVNEQREGARAVKEELVVEAEALAGLHRVGRHRREVPRPDAPVEGRRPGSARRRRPAVEALPRRPGRVLRRPDAANAAQDSEFAANAEKKEALLVEAEKLLPVTDVRAARDAFRDIAERWDAAGKVPRERMKDLEGRMRKVEQAIRGVEDDEWRRSNPEATARAADTVAQLEASIADLQAKHDKAVEAGNDKRAAEHAAALEARKAWLAEAQKAFEEFSG